MLRLNWLVEVEMIAPASATQTMTREHGRPAYAAQSIVPYFEQIMLPLNWLVVVEMIVPV